MENHVRIRETNPEDGELCKVWRDEYSGEGRGWREERTVLLEGW